jgi:hypothetical protein
MYTRKQRLEKLSQKLFARIIVYKMFSLHVLHEIALVFCPMQAIWATKLRFFSAFISNMNK